MSINDVSYPNNQIRTNLFRQMVLHLLFHSLRLFLFRCFFQSHHINEWKIISTSINNKVDGKQQVKHKFTKWMILLVDFRGVSILFWMRINCFIHITALTVECLLCQTADCITHKHSQILSLSYSLSPSIFAELSSPSDIHYLGVCVILSHEFKKYF